MRSKIWLAGTGLALALAFTACTSTDSVTDGREGPETRQTPAAIEQDAGAEPGPAVGTAGEAGTVRLSEIAGAPDEYIGRTVTVVADIEEVFGPNAFALDEDAPIAGGIDNDVLVLSTKAGSLAPIDDQWMNNRVRVTGTVGKMSVVEVEREIGWDLDPELEAELERRTAVLIAQSVQRVEGDGEPAGSR